MGKILCGEDKMKKTFEISWDKGNLPADLLQYVLCTSVLPRHMNFTARQIEPTPEMPTMSIKERCDVLLDEPYKITCNRKRPCSIHDKPEPKVWKEGY